MALKDPRHPLDAKAPQHDKKRTTPVREAQDGERFKCDAPKPHPGLEGTKRRSQ